MTVARKGVHLRREELASLNTLEPIFQDDLVDNLSARNASPPQKILTISIKLFENHHSVAPVAFHDISLPCGMAGWGDLPRLLRWSNPQIDLPSDDTRLSSLHTQNFI
jgi:hypothetical protein